MSVSGRRLPTAWLVAALLLGLAAACSDAGDPAGAGGAPGRGVYVHSVWQTAREVNGHLVHVVSEKIACSKCHELTGDSIGKVSPRSCAPCHEKEARIEHAVEQAHERFGPEARADCTTCHAFSVADPSHDPSNVHGPADCRRCHLQQQGDTSAVKVHHRGDCVPCHTPHDEQKPTAAACSECHDMEPTHAVHGKTLTEACTTCHQEQHAPAETARLACASCHSREKPIVPPSALFAGGHTECVGCHRPHEFAKTKAVACRSCHEDVLVLGARIAEHADCTSCHNAHDVKGSPDRACATCHSDKHPDHPKRGVTGTCVGCHEPHPPSARASSRARRCTSCHQAAASDRDFHAGTQCTECHRPHGFVGSAATRNLCQNCHARELGLVATAPGHQKCASCHGGLPHRPAALTASCESCHGRQRAEVASGHGNCTSCHEPHGGGMSMPCKSCHTDQHRSAVAGHQDCQSCHAPHSGSLGKIRCATCHAQAAKAPHAEVPQSCNACHRAHGPGGVAKPPPCSSCHSTTSLAGLHRVPNHQACATCHTGHGEETRGAARSACLTCHADRKNHFPEAPRCSSCHLFKKTR